MGTKWGREGEAGAGCEDRQLTRASERAEGGGCSSEQQAVGCGRIEHVLAPIGTTEVGSVPSATGFEDGTRQALPKLCPTRPNPPSHPPLRSIVKEAFYLARSGRPGPVLVDVPKDIQQQLAVPDWDAPMSITGGSPQSMKP